MKKHVQPAVSAEWPDPKQLLQRARELVQTIEGFIHLTPEERRRINTAATLPEEFYTSGSVLLDEYEWLATASQLTGEEVRRMLEDTPGYNSLADELELLARGLRSTLASRRATIGQRLLLMYEIAKRSNRSGDEPYMKRVEQLQQILRGRRRVKPKAEDEAAE